MGKGSWGSFTRENQIHCVNVWHLLHLLCTQLVNAILLQCALRKKFAATTSMCLKGLIGLNCLQWPQDTIQILLLQDEAPHLLHRCQFQAEQCQWHKSSLSASHIPLHLQHHHIVISQKSYPIHNHRKFEQKLLHTGLFLKTFHSQGLDLLPSEKFLWKDSEFFLWRIFSCSSSSSCTWWNAFPCTKKIVTTCASKSFRNRFGLNWKPCERRERKQERKGILRNKDKVRKQGVCHTH